VKEEGIFHMTDTDPLASHEDTHHIETVRLHRPAMTVDPDSGRTTELPLFPPIDRLHRASKPVAAPSFDLDKGNHAVALDHEVDIAMPTPEPTLEHPPASAPKPPLRYPLTQLAERLPGR
jgi:hypothetical protein